MDSKPKKNTWQAPVIYFEIVFEINITFKTCIDHQKKNMYPYIRDAFTINGCTLIKKNRSRWIWPHRKNNSSFNSDLSFWLSVFPRKINRIIRSFSWLCSSGFVITGFIMLLSRTCFTSHKIISILFFNNDDYFDRQF